MVVSSVMTPLPDAGHTLTNLCSRRKVVFEISGQEHGQFAEPSMALWYSCSMSQCQHASIPSCLPGRQRKMRVSCKQTLCHLQHWSQSASMSAG